MPSGIYTRTLEARERLRRALLGKPKSPETIERLRISAICQWDGLPRPIWPKRKIPGKIKSDCRPGSYVRTEEIRKKNRMANTGRKRGPYSEDHKQKIRLALLGKKKSPDHAEKCRQNARIKFQSGHIPWNTGKPSPKRGKPQIQTKGENNPNWKGGITKNRNKVCSSGEYKNWRRLTLEKYGHICQRCGVKANTVHHLFNFVDYPDLRFDVENGIPLNSECHINFHHKYGFRNNTPTQMMEFLKDSNSVLTGETQIKMGMEI